LLNPRVVVDLHGAFTLGGPGLLSMSPHVSNMATKHVATWKTSLCLANLLKFNPFFLSPTLLG
jgi:hypothetical protein